MIRILQIESAAKPLSACLGVKKLNSPPTLVIPATIAVASVEFVLPATIVGATTAAAGLSLLALVLLLATLAASCLTTLVVLL